MQGHLVTTHERKFIPSAAWCVVRDYNNCAGESSYRLRFLKRIGSHGVREQDSEAKNSEAMGKAGPVGLTAHSCSIEELRYDVEVVLTGRGAGRDGS